MKLSTMARSKLMTMLIFTHFFLLANNNIYAKIDADETIQKEIIANYDGYEFNETVPVIFKNKPYFITTSTDGNGEYILSTKTFADDYKQVSEHSFLFSKILDIDKKIAKNYFYYIDVKANENFIFVLLTTHDQQNKIINKYLIQSPDGKSWSLNESFFTLNNHDCADSINSKNNLVSLSCSKQDYAERFFFSTDNGNTWKTNVVSTDLKLSSQTIIVNNTFFVTTADDSSTSQDLYLTNNDGQFIKSQIDPLKRIFANQLTTPAQFKYSDVINIFAVGDALLAQAEYQMVTFNNNTNDKHQYFMWSSQDNGLTWSLLDINLPHQAITQLKKHDDRFYILTLGQEWNDENLYYYSIHAHDFIHNDAVELKPLAVFPYSSGYFLDYESYEKTLLILKEYNDYHGFRVEFTKIKYK